jgi:hypothetical protein
MAVSFANLDGEYEVFSETSDGGPYVVNGDGVTTVKNGLTYRKDNKGYIWESSFSVIGPDKIAMESTVDPSHADVFILDEKGNPTKGIVNFKTILDAQLVDGKIIMAGTIKHGNETTKLTMKQR